MKEMRKEEVEELARRLKGWKRDTKRRVFYHLTHKSNLRSILNRGLLPSGTIKTVGGFGEQTFEYLGGAIFLGRSIKECVDQLRINRFIGIWTPKIRDMVLLKVRLPEGYEVDADDAGLLYVVEPIPPEYIEVVRQRT